MKKVIFIGKTGCGKTTLCQKLNECEVKYRKTQAVEKYDDSIDTPGEYLENRHFYSALIMSAVDAKVIALVADPTSDRNFIPPAFAGTFSRKVIGIITKISLVTDEKQIGRVVTELAEAGASPIFQVDTIEGLGIKELMEFFDDIEVAE